MEFVSNTPTLKTILELARQEIEKEFGIDFYYSRKCEQLSQFLLNFFQTKNIKAEIKTYSGWDILTHEFLIINNSIIIDATWQQFLDQPNSNKPRILVCNKRIIEQKLRNFGVLDKWLGVWKT